MTCVADNVVKRKAVDAAEAEAVTAGLMGCWRLELALHNVIMAIGLSLTKARLGLVSPPLMFPGPVRALIPQAKPGQHTAHRNMLAAPAGGGYGAQNDTVDSDAVKADAAQDDAAGALNVAEQVAESEQQLS